MTVLLKIGYLIMATAFYQFYIDWDDDGYASPFAEIPDEHLAGYKIDYGSNLTNGIYDWGFNTGSSSLTLFDPGGLYYIPGDPGSRGRLNERQLGRPHAWKLVTEGQEDRFGSAFPIYGEVLGAEVQPVTWRLAGPTESNLDVRTELAWDVSSATTSASSASSVADTCNMIQEVSSAELNNGGLVIRSNNATQLIEAVEHKGTWGDLMLQLAYATGGALVETYDGTYVLQDAIDNEFALREAQPIYDYTDLDLGIGSGSGVSNRT